MDKKKTWILIGVALVTGCVINIVVMRRLEGVSVKPVVQEEAVDDETVSGRLIVAPSVEMTMMVVMDPSRTYNLHFVSLNGEQIGRFKSQGERIFDMSGDVPDGKVAFENTTTKTYGNAEWRDGAWDGEYREYFKTGQLRFIKEYDRGKIVWMKEYFTSGDLRMEIDYRDALNVPDEVETGHGIVYFNDGRVMYEWNLTNRDPNRYKKAYNRHGQLVEILRFDPSGQLIKTERVTPVETEVAL